MNQAVIATDEDRAAREIYWRTKLRRLRFGAEPLRVQVERYRRVTIVLSVISGSVALGFLAIFSSFRRPDVALVLDAILFVPIVGLAWLDFGRLAKDVADYEAERQQQGLQGTY